MFFLKSDFKLDFMMKSANSICRVKLVVKTITGNENVEKYETTFQEVHKSPEGNNVDVVLC